MDLTFRALNQKVYTIAFQAPDKRFFNLRAADASKTKHDLQYKDRQCFFYRDRIVSVEKKMGRGVWWRKKHAIGDREA